MFGAITQHFAFCVCKTQFMWNWSIWEIAKFGSWWLLTILVGYFQLFLSFNNSSARRFSALVSFIMPFPFGNSFVVFLYPLCFYCSASFCLLQVIFYGCHQKHVKPVTTDVTWQKRGLCWAREQLSLLPPPPVASAVGPSDFDMLFPGGVVFYHYTTWDNLRGILATQTILPSPPHPATPGRFRGSSLKNGVVFLTRMDPTNSKRAIAYNNYRWLSLNNSKVGSVLEIVF